MCLPRGNEAMRIMIYSVMTQKEFIKVLDKKGYSYEIEGDRIVVTHEGDVDLGSLKSLPSGVNFRNIGYVDLESLESLHPNLEFRNEGDVFLKSITSIPRGVVFRNVWGDVFLSIIEDWFSDWEGNMEGIDSKRLLNSMINKGVFER
jgi:hypothetical protein